MVRFWCGTISVPRLSYSTACMKLNASDFGDLQLVSFAFTAKQLWLLRKTRWTRIIVIRLAEVPSVVAVLVININLGISLHLWAKWLLLRWCVTKITKTWNFLVRWSTGNNLSLMFLPKRRFRWAQIYEKMFCVNYSDIWGTFLSIFNFKGAQKNVLSRKLLWKEIPKKKNPLPDILYLSFSLPTYFKFSNLAYLQRFAKTESSWCRRASKRVIGW